LRVLHLEDDPLDAELVAANLAEEGLHCEVQLVTCREEFLRALAAGHCDLILADYALPDFDGMSALRRVREGFPDLPFVFVSGRLGEEAAIESLKNGATDYVLKTRLSRLVPAVKRALNEAQERAELRRAEAELERAYLEISERAETYQNLFTSIRDVIVVTDHERNIRHVNQPALRETFGYELEEVAGKGVRMLYAQELGYRLTGQIFRRPDTVKGQILELEFRRKNGEIFYGELYALKQLDSSGTPTGYIGLIRDINEKKLAEDSLRESEMRRYQMQVELVYAAEVQAKLLPHVYPQIPGFEIAAQCLPAKQVGGDFFDWQEVCPGLWSLTLGDVMGKGIAAAMLMATVRASLRSVTPHNRPAKALELAEHALLPDLENSESFVTLFHSQLYAQQRRVTFVDCGHGYAFLRRRDGRVEELSPRGLPLGVPGQKAYQEGSATLETGDSLVIFSDGLIDARPDLNLNNRILAGLLDAGMSAQEIVGRLMAVTEAVEPLPDDVTVLVVRCTA
jgi:PAS domain S-box-containing protein